VRDIYRLGITATFGSVQSSGVPLILTMAISGSLLVGCSDDEPTAQVGWCDSAGALFELEDENGSSARLEDSGAEQRERSEHQTAASGALVSSAPDDLDDGTSDAVLLIDDAYQRQHAVFEKYGFDRLRVLTEANLAEQNELLLARSDRVVAATDRLRAATNERCS
jgi:hypothetical protein